MLGTVYGGDFYTVIDTKMPWDRIRKIFSVLKPAAIITDRDHEETVREALASERKDSPKILLYEKAMYVPEDREGLAKIRRKAVDTDLVYTLFTSGSTGMPKGVAVSHRNVMAYAEWVKTTFDINEATVFGSQTPFYFSMSVLDIYTTLAAGAELQILPKQLFAFPVRLLEYMNSRKVNTIYWVPTALSIVANWKVLDYVSLPYMEKVLFAGEVMPVKQLNYWRRKMPELLYANLYGPTEVTDICAYYIVDRDFADSETLPIGRACDNCDLLIAVGCRFSDRVALKPETFAHQAKIVHVDIDRAEINKNVQTDHHIIGDAKQVLNLLLERLPQYEHKEWKDFVLSFPRETEYGESESVLTPKQVLSTIARKCPQDSIVATDVGQHQMWAIQHLHFDYPGQLLTSGGFGTMGFGLGAAIGAKQGNPDKTVIHITGDGCFRMNGNELATVAYYGLPVITVIFNNRNLGMVRQWQSLIYDHRYSQTSLENRSPDFVKFADAFGLKGRRVTQPSELEEAITEALAESAQGRGYVIDCAINADEMVHPMVNGGHHITEFLLS